jgi:diacylglycerol kinase family enzyme
MKSVACVLNPLSGSRPQINCMPRMRAMLEARAVKCIEVAIGSGYEDELESVIRETPDLTAVAGIGGDGTHMSVINALMSLPEEQREHLPPYALVPFGTGNDVAKSLGITPGAGSLQDAVNVMLGDGILHMDLGRFDGKFFADAVSIGVDPSILTRRNELQGEFTGGTLVGYGFYLAASAIAVPTFRDVNATVVIDGETWYEGRLTSMVVNNSSIYAGELALTPETSVTDGLLDVRRVTGKFAYSTTYMRSWRRFPPMRNSDTCVQATTVEICLDRALPVQVDGELLEARDHLTIDCVPAAIDVKVPTP